MHISKTKIARELWFLAFCSLYRPPIPPLPGGPELPLGGVRLTLRTTALHTYKCINVTCYVAISEIYTLHRQSMRCILEKTFYYTGHVT